MSANRSTRLYNAFDKTRFRPRSPARGSAGRVALSRVPGAAVARRIARHPRIFGLLVLALASAAAAAEPVRVSRSRLVHRFDFEATDSSGRKFGRAHELPRHWYVIGREAGTQAVSFRRQPLHQRLIEKPAFPRFTDVGFDDAHATSGDYSFHLGLNSGNAGAFLEVGALPAVPRSDYLVTARVRTDRLQRSRARLVAYFVDDQGQRIEASVRRTEPIDTGDTWTTVQARLEGTFDEAAWIGLELRLMQPRPQARHPLDEQQIVLKDVRGDVWFDDISIWQLPHIQVATQSPVNILRGDDRPRLRGEVRDMTGQALSATLTVYDHRRRAVAQQQRRVGAGAANQWRWQPDLPGYGWYLTELTVRERSADGSANEPIARRLGAFLWLPRAGPLHASDESRFGLVADSMPRERLSLLTELTDQTRLVNLVLSAWTRDTRAAKASSQQKRFSRAIKPLMLSSERLSMSFSPVPDALARRAGEEGNFTLRVLAKAPKHWLPYVRAALHWHGQYVKRWQLGATGDDRAFFFPDLADTVARIDSRLKRLVPGPRVVLPWTLHQPPNEALPDSAMYTIDVPPAIHARQLDRYLKPWQDSERGYRLNLRQRPADVISHPQRVRQLALRMLYAWEADRPTMTLDKPWTRAMERRHAILPDPLLGVFATTAQRLAGRRVIGRLPIGEGMEAMILDGPRGGMLAVWNRSAPPDRAELHMHLGQSPTAIDVWGNRRELQGDEAGKHRLRVKKTPTFITGIDPELAMFRAGFAITEPFIESRQTPHHRRLRLTNPWQHTITGEVRFTGPKNWTIRPGQHSFSIPAGQTKELPVTFSFPISAVAGDKQLGAEVEFSAQRQYHISTGAPMQLGLENVKFEPTLAVEAQADGTSDVIVNAVITNQGEEPLGLYVFANIPGRRRKERLVAQLEAGESVIRRFQFDDAAGAARRSAVRTGLRETNGPAILNKVLRVGDAP